MNKESKQFIKENYRNLFIKFGSGAEVGQWSVEGQLFRFKKLIQIDNLKGSRVLDLGCGIGDLYPFLLEHFENIDYTGIDIVPELVEYAAKRYPASKFLCCDILRNGINSMFDYILISGMFNNDIPKCTDFLKKMISVAFKHTIKGLSFNFISTCVTYRGPEMAYHDPLEIFDFCLRKLAKKVTMHHHYERCDVAIFVYKG